MFDALNMDVSGKKVITLKGYSAGAERPAFDFPVKDCFLANLHKGHVRSVQFVAKDVFGQAYYLEFRQTMRAACDLRKTARWWKLKVHQYRRFPPWSSLTT